MHFFLRCTNLKIPLRSMSVPETAITYSQLPGLLRQLWLCWPFMGSFKAKSRLHDGRGSTSWWLSAIVFNVRRAVGGRSFSGGRKRVFFVAPLPQSAGNNSSERLNATNCANVSPFHRKPITHHSGFRQILINTSSTEVCGI